MRTPLTLFMRNTGRFWGVVGLFFLLSTKSIFAADMVVSPQTQTYVVGDTFTIDLQIDGKNQDFNAAQAYVSTSSNLSVESVTLGDCHFAFVITPAKSSLQFAGAILGGYERLCTVYSIGLKAISVGSGYVTIQNASVKSYTGSTEILSSTKSGIYTIVANGGGTSVPTPTSYTSNGYTSTPTPVTNNVYTLTQSTPSPTRYSSPTPPSTYTLKVQVKDSAGEPVTQSRVQLEGNSQQAVTNTNGVAEFTAVPAGTHTVTATDSTGKTLSAETLTLGGTSPTIELGIQDEKTEPSFWIWVIPCFVLLLILLGILVWQYKKRNMAFGRQSFFRKSTPTSAGNESLFFTQKREKGS